MWLLTSVVGSMRTALVAVLVLAWLGMSMASAHVMPCSHATPFAEHVSSVDSANHDAVVHFAANAIDKRADARPASCCTSMCSLCNAPVAAGSGEQPQPILVKHRLDRGDWVAGIFVGQPHGPPRR